MGCQLWRLTPKSQHSTEAKTEGAGVEGQPRHYLKHTRTHTPSHAGLDQRLLPSFFAAVELQHSQPVSEMDQWAGVGILEGPIFHVRVMLARSHTWLLIFFEPIPWTE